MSNYRKLPRIAHKNLPSEGYMKITADPRVTFQNSYNSPSKFFGIIEDGRKKVWTGKHFEEKDLNEEFLDKMFNVDMIFPDGGIPSLQVTEAGKKGMKSCPEIALVLKKAGFKDLVSTVILEELEQKGVFTGLIGKVVKFELIPSIFERDGEKINYIRIKFHPADKQLKFSDVAIATEEGTKEGDNPNKDAEDLW